MGRDHSIAEHLETRVTATEVGRTPGDLIDRALEGPIAIERRGKVKAVIMSATEFDRLKRGNDARIAGKVQNVPAALMAAALASIDGTLDGDDA